jgi:hypothetical protein
MTDILKLPGSGTHPLPGLEMPLTIEEMDGLGDSLVFKLFLDDVEDIASKQKGKAKEGHFIVTHPLQRRIICSSGPGESNPSPSIIPWT